VQFDDEANIFHGDIINLRDVITFEGETVEELLKAFNPDYAVNTYCDLKNLAATLVSRFCFSTCL
jgi:predicted HicB family RNase H-like nuclease